MNIVLMSGIAGSGKSTYVKENLLCPIVCSADDYFMKDGKYCFDASKLSEAHGACLKKFVSYITGDLLSFGNNVPLVVDNTNLTALELAPYVTLANAYGFTPTIHTMKMHPNCAVIRNIHGVPIQSLNRMADTLSKREIPRYWKVNIVNHDMN